MPALGIEMHLGWHLRVLQRQKVNGGVFDMNRVVFGLHDERGRSLAGGVDVGVGCEVLVSEGEITGVNDHGKIRTAAFAIGGVERIVKTLIEVRAQCRGEVSAGGESENAHAVRIDVPFPGMHADNAKSAL